MFAAFWSIVALILTGAIIWLIFSDDEKVKRMMKLDDESQAAKAAAAAATATTVATAGDADSADIESPTEAMLDVLNKPAAATAGAMLKAEEHFEAPLESAAEQVSVNFTATQDEVADAEVADATEAPSEVEAETTDGGAQTEVPEVEAERSTEIVVDAVVEESADATSVDTTNAEEKMYEAAADATEMAEEAAALGGATKIVVPTTDNYPDPLTKLNGIGDVYERRLYEAGVFTWYQITETPIVKLAEITQAIDAANVDDWPAQARRLAEDADRMGVRYSGPMPDKLTAIPGVGPAMQQDLRAHGIVTYHQLAIAPAVKVEAILGSSGKRADIPAIIAKAKELA